uniref:Uncharacterized protein n=1 Tax=Dunaliella tertiolecta TaxID=3047 RepID=A0A6S8M6V2_DUNTE
MAEKEWHLRGEVAAGHRPLNSALEVDVDFDTTVKPPPEPTEEAMADIEALIKRRIADHQFDDVVRVLPPPPERKRREIDLDDNKASKGLGEVYEEQYVKNVVGNTSEDKDEKVRNEARMLFQALVGKLDALTHFHFAPKPVVEDLNVRSDVAAVVMEEAAPVAVGNAAANMQLPGEVFRPQDAGAPKAEGEMTREDRKRQRAQHKQASKAAREQKEAERNARAAALGQKMPLPSDSTLPAPVAGRKSAALAAATGGKKGAKAAAKAAAAALGQGALKHGKTEFGRSGAVFAKLQQEQDMARANGGQLPKKKGHQQLGQDGGKPALAAAFLKL